MLPRLHMDDETGATVKLKDVGACRYLADRNTVVHMMSFAFHHSRLVETWRAGEPFPAHVAEHVANGGMVVAHNAMFERWAWNVTLPKMGYRLPTMTIAQTDCTMARCAVQGLPMDLEGAGRVLNRPEIKDGDGKKAMVKLSTPKGFAPDGSPVWWEQSSAVWQETEEYNRQDVRAEMGLDDVVSPLTAREREIWELDQAINDRGVLLDIASATKFKSVVEAALAEANARVAHLTGGAIKKISQTVALVKWFQGRGVPIDSLAKGDQDMFLSLMKAFGDDVAYEVFKIRLDAGKASTAKMSKMIECAGADGRARHVLQFHAAQTGRWGGRLYQPQNFPRVDEKRDLPDVRTLFELAEGDALEGEGLLSCMKLACSAEPMEVFSKALRSLQMAAPGKKLVGADLSNIEGRIAAWITGEAWKVQAFRDYDAGTGPDIYKLTYSKSFSVPVENVEPSQRQIGKVQELASGYQGSINAYLSMAAVYNLDPKALAVATHAACDPAEWARVEATYPTARDKCGLDAFVWTGVKITVNRWRAAHPNIVQGWWDLQDAAIEATLNPGRVVPCLHNEAVAFVHTSGFLLCKLPSTRVMWYAAATVRWVDTPRWLFTAEGEQVSSDSVPAETPLFDDMGTPVPPDERVGRRRRQVFYYRRRSGQWVPSVMYGGQLMENVVSGLARDVMADGMMRVEKAGYPVTLSVHDEACSEVAANFGGADHYASLIATVPSYTPGLPLAAKGWEGERYTK